jgi:methyl-accepting chemotaxis protein
MGGFERCPKLKINLQAGISSGCSHQVIGAIEGAFGDSSRETDNVSEIVKEQLSMIREVASASEELSAIAQELQDATGEIAVVK